jgi:hypothetical protein
MGESDEQQSKMNDDSILILRDRELRVKNHTDHGHSSLLSGVSLERIDSKSSNASFSEILWVQR